ncbi:hypothetical protein OF83DRAFT_1180105, partial [Amylostereum chailletii]
MPKGRSSKSILNFSAPSVLAQATRARKVTVKAASEQARARRAREEEDKSKLTSMMRQNLLEASIELGGLDEALDFDSLPAV